MRCLSIRQPWAWAIVESTKRIENRSWNCKYRGPILIHAAKGMTNQEYDGFYQFWTEELRRVETNVYPTPPRFNDLQRGGIIGRAEIVDCVHENEIGKFDRFPPERNRALVALQSPWFFGPNGIVLDNVKALPFIPYRGELGLFEVPDHITQEHVGALV